MKSESKLKFSIGDGKYNRNLLDYEYEFLIDIHSLIIYLYEYHSKSNK